MAPDLFKKLLKYILNFRQCQRKQLETKRLIEARTARMEEVQRAKREAMAARKREGAGKTPTAAAPAPVESAAEA
jgi:Na+-translocating ferredoxin:NAD+ oxidoreductase subunit C